MLSWSFYLFLSKVIIIHQNTLMRPFHLLWITGKSFCSMDIFFMHFVGNTIHHQKILIKYLFYKMILCVKENPQISVHEHVQHRQTMKFLAHVPEWFHSSFVLIAMKRGMKGVEKQKTIIYKERIFTISSTYCTINVVHPWCFLYKRQGTLTTT